MKSAPTPKIRYRTRRGYIREICGYGTWDEVQVVVGRRVVFRGDTTEQAKRFIRDEFPALHSPPSVSK